jgi:hypothetical protein
MEGKHMTKSKLVWAIGAFALVVASGVTFRLVTGKCPVGAMCEMIHGTPAPAETHATTNP